MPRIMACPSCQLGVQVPDHLLGRRVRCTGCGKVFTPEPDPASPPPAVAEPQESPHVQAEAPRPGPEEPAARRPPQLDADEDDRPWERRRRPRRWEEDEDDRPWERRRRRWRPSRANLLSRVSGPGILLQIYGILLALVALGCLVGLLVTVVLLIQNGGKPASGSDASDVGGLLVFCGIGALYGFVAGPLIFLGGMRMKAFRSYGLAMTATILVLVTGVLTCLPLVAVGIWPLKVLQDVDVKEAFTHPPDEDWEE